MNKRLDIYMVDEGMTDSRSKAKAMIVAGKVKVNGKVITKPSYEISEDAEAEIFGETLRYVSRGGLKLEKAIESFGLSLQDKTCVDIGASTGGFTDCMLQNGAKKVYAVDVGSGQLDSSLIHDKRVVNLENTNIRYLEKSLINENIDFISIDVSFISLKLVLPVAFELVSEEGEIVALIKPQFEAGKTNIGKHGVVKNKNVHIKVIKDIKTFVESNRYSVVNLDYSPVKGPKGNIEYLIRMTRNAHCEIGESDIKHTVNLSHEHL